VKPLSIMLFDQSHCLLAWCLTRDDYRAFRLDRMSDLHVTDRSFRPGRVPLLKTYLDNLNEAAGDRLVRF
jgi:predicted DNA-binding transcriptional regulator YafY